MKRINVVLLFALTLASTACRNPVIPPEYALEFPALPVPWQEMLGNAHWRLVWLNPQGIPQSRETDGKGIPAIATVVEWATPVLAFPYWPGRGILPGEMRPAGAILPFDARGNRLQLSWRGGAEAWFYRELAAARSTAITSAAAGKLDSGTFNKRRPEYFDWPRFRVLMDSDSIPGAIRDDPWRADWSDIAVRTILSGFDRRSIKVQAGEELLVSRALNNTSVPRAIAAEGPFAGPSPFARLLSPEPGVGYRFTVTPRADTYVSAGGILRVSRKTWVYYSF